MKYLRYLISYVLSFAYDVYYFFFGDIGSRIAGPRYYAASKRYPGYLKVGNMAAAVFTVAEKYCRGRGLDIGAGRWPFPGARAIEASELSGEDAYGIKEDANSQDFIFSSHSLEHLADWQGALREWNRVLKPGGSMVIYAPHPSVIMWKPGINREHLTDLGPGQVISFLEQTLGMKITESNRLPDGFLSFLVVAQKR